MARLVMRLMTAQAALASAFCAGRVRARRLRPIKTLYLSIATSTKERRPYWTARCQPSRPRLLDLLDVAVAPGGRSFGGVAHHRGRARRDDHLRIGAVGGHAAIESYAGDWVMTV